MNCFSSNNSPSPRAPDHEPNNSPIGKRLPQSPQIQHGAIFSTSRKVFAHCLDHQGGPCAYIRALKSLTEASGWSEIHQRRTLKVKTLCAINKIVSNE